MFRSSSIIGMECGTEEWEAKAFYGRHSYDLWFDFRNRWHFWNPPRLDSALIIFMRHRSNHFSYIFFGWKRWDFICSPSRPRLFFPPFSLSTCDEFKHSENLFTTRARKNDLWIRDVVFDPNSRLSGIFFTKSTQPRATWMRFSAIKINWA